MHTSQPRCNPIKKAFTDGCRSFRGGVVNLYKNQGNLHIHDSGKKEIQIKREKIYTNSDGCRDIHFGK